MRILLFGRDGQLGWELNRILAHLADITSTDQDELDLIHKEQIPIFIQTHRPDIIINAAAYTDVDAAETDAENAYAVNAHAPDMMAEEAKKLDALLIHFSTDYVFDGRKTDPYTENDNPNPINVYGQSKLAGEKAVRHSCENHLILRTSWLYGMRQSSFPTKLMGWARNQKVVRIVDDQIGSPTWCRMLAEVTASIVTNYEADRVGWTAEYPGTYHVAGKGQVSRYEFGRLVLELDPDPDSQIMEELQAANTNDFPTPADRPRFSALDCARFENTFGFRLPSWDHSLARAMVEEHDGS